MADKRAYFKLDVGYLTNPKIAVALVDSPAAILLHIGSIAYSAQHLTDGVVPMKLVARLSGADPEDVAVLLDHGLWHDLGDGRAEIHDYLEHQRSAGEAKGASVRAQTAAKARWKQDEDKPSMLAGMPPSMPPGMPGASESSMPRERERKRDNNTGADAPDNDFATFYDLYPKKVGKPQALKAYKAAVKKATPDVILDGLQKHLPGWANTERKFIPNPATWLNGERWTDEEDATQDVNPWAHLKSGDQLAAERGF